MEEEKEERSLTGQLVNPPHPEYVTKKMLKKHIYELNQIFFQLQKFHVKQCLCHNYFKHGELDMTEYKVPMNLIKRAIASLKIEIKPEVLPPHFEWLFKSIEQKEFVVNDEEGDSYITDQKELFSKPKSRWKFWKRRK